MVTRSWYLRVPYEQQSFFLRNNCTQVIPVTEMVTGIDLVKEQLKVAAGEELKIGQKDITYNVTQLSVG